MAGDTLMEVQGLDAGYGKSQVLFGMQLRVGAGQCATLLAQHPCRYGAPVRHAPDAQDHPATADRGQKVA